MERLGIIGGSAFLRGGSPAGSEERRVPTDRGEVLANVASSYVFIRRHGHDRYHPPHRINHHAHVLALESLGVHRAVALCSVGALTPALRPGTVVIPDDYLSFHPPPTFADDERLHIVPRLDPDIRQRLLALSRAATTEDEAWGSRSPAGAARTDVHDGGVYAETRGPRFETRAEIRMLAAHADVVGMTGASEATLLQERGIASAILGIVDNYAHGIDVRPLTMEAFDRQLEENSHRARAILDRLIEDARASGSGAGDAGRAGSGTGGSGSGESQ